MGKSCFARNMNLSKARTSSPTEQAVSKKCFKEKKRLQFCMQLRRTEKRPADIPLSAG